MKEKVKIIALIAQIVMLVWIVDVFWEFLSQKGDLNIFISITAFVLIGIFWVPYIIKQVKNLW